MNLLLHRESHLLLLILLQLQFQLLPWLLHLLDA
jgi:hypothetical protein